MHSRRIVIASALLLCAVAGAYTAYWFHVADEVRKGLGAWADERRAAGWQVGWAELTMEGFPLCVTARLSRPELAAPGGGAWQADSLSAASSPFNLGRVRLSAAGRHRLSFGPWRTEFTAGDLRGDIGIESGHVRDAHFTAAAVASPDGPAADALALSVTPTAAGLSFAATATGLQLGQAPGGVLDARIALAEITGRVAGPLPAPPLTQAAARWSADGGTVEIERLILDWPPMALEADGTVALDPALQPLAAFSAKVRGYGQLMDNLARAGMVEPGAAEAAKMLLSLMAKPDSRGRSAVPVPVTVQDGRLWLGPARVAQFPPLAWPAPTN